MVRKSSRKKTKNADVTEEVLTGGPELPVNADVKPTRERRAKNLKEQSLVEDSGSDFENEIAEIKQKPKRTKQKSSKNQTKKKKESKNCIIDSSTTANDNKGDTKPRKGVNKSKTAAKKSKQEPAASETVKKECDNRDEDSEADSEISDWEDVEDLQPAAGNELGKHQVPEQPVEVTLTLPNIMKKKRKKRGFDMEEWFRLQMNRFKKKSQLELHKVHLLCLLAAGIRYRNCCNDATVQAISLSLIPSPMLGQRSPQDWSLPSLSQLVKWFCDEFDIDPDLKENTKDMNAVLVSRLETQKTASELECVLIFIAICRAIGLDVRLAYSLQAVTFKAKDLREKSSGEPKDVIDIDDEPEISKESAKSSKQSSAIKQNNAFESPQNTQRDEIYDILMSQEGTGTVEAKEISSVLPSMSSSASTATEVVKTAPESTTDAIKVQPKNKQKRKNSSKIDCAEQEVEDQGKGSKRKKATSGKKSGKQNKSKLNEDDDVVQISSDEDFDPDVKNFRSPTSNPKKRKKQKILSSDDSNNSCDVSKLSAPEQGSDFWAEVYLSTESKWICVDCIRNRVDHPKKMESLATKPLCYVLGFNDYGRIKDLTRRYSSRYMSHTRKLRVDAEWWDDTLAPYGPQGGTQAEHDVTEDLNMQAQMLDKPFPTSVSEYKNHPLYALKRHLLKFEAIYPDTSVPLNHIRGEPVYARECVHVLHSRENWMKEARAVRIGEEPYKMVKSRKRKTSAAPSGEILTELFGVWQTEDYIPPPAVNGKVPRNEYGNVELFKPSMLPGGTVQLQLAGLNKIAKKLDIDCAAAMVGWDHHGGFSHPLMDGWVVCEEHREVLEAAWLEDQAIQTQREADKREKRVVENWKALVKGLFIRERMKKRFQLESPEKLQENEKSEASKDTTKAKDLEMSWPRNLQATQPKASTSKKSAKDKTNLFPFEVEEL